MPTLPLKHRGAATELEAAVWLLNQGYEVFRNVSQHGPIDLIAIRADEKPLLLDVKTARYARQRATEEQRNLGVKFLAPRANGFEIFEPYHPFDRTPVKCIFCGTLFRPNREGSQFCNDRCRANHRYANGRPVPNKKKAAVPFFYSSPPHKARVLIDLSD
jgi:hypothetical protein